MTLFGNCDHMRNPQRTIMFVVLSALIVCTVFPREAKAEPQDSQNQQSQSLVDAARRSRELKKNAAQPAKVFTNGDLDMWHTKPGREDFGVSALAVPQTESPNASAVAAAQTPNQSSTSPNKESALKSNESEAAAAEDTEISRLEDQLASAQNALIWQRRQLLLDQNTIYTNPAYTTTHAGKSELDSARLQIDEMQQEVDRMKGPLANLVWRQWRRMQAGAPDNGSPAESYKSVPPSALVLPQPQLGQR
jgi:hypothetical protein